MRKLIPLVLIAIAGNASGEDLMQIYQQAAENDPQIRSAEAGHEAVKQSRRQSKALYLPSVDLSANRTRNKQDITSSSGFFSTGSSSYTSTGYTLSLRQALYRYDYISQLKQSSATEQQSEAEFRSAEQALILRVAKAYFDVLAAQDSLDFAESEKNAIARQLEQTKQRFEVGLIAITDVHESQAAHDLAVAGEISARNTLAITKQALQEITATLPESLNPLNDKMALIKPDPNNIEQWVENALAQNFSVIAAEAATEASRQQLKLSSSDRHPEIDLVASHTYSDIGGGSFGSRETEDTAVGVQLTIPLFRGGSINAGIKAANYQLTQAKENLEQTRRAAQRETRDAFLSVQAGISRVQALKQAVVSTESALTATEAGYDVGTRTTVDVLNARRELFRAQRDYARSRYDYILASLRLKQASGILTAADLEQINGWLN